MLWYRPAARRSKSDATITTPSSRASLPSAVGGRAGDGLGQVEIVVIFFAAEVLRAEQLLQADDLRAALGGVADGRHGAVEILFRVERALSLQQPDW